MSIQSPESCFLNAKRGFTLIELLVVIAIIALLIGIMLPALGSARASAQALKNTTNLRSLQLGIQLYAMEYKSFPPFRLPSGESHPGTDRPRARWHWFAGDQIGRPYSPSGQEELDDFMNAGAVHRIDNEVFIDPTQRLEDFVRGSTQQVEALRNGSYGYNYHYLGNSRNDHPIGQYNNWPVREHSIARPAKTISIGDSLGNQETYEETGYREHSYTLDPPRLDTKHNNAHGFAQSDLQSPAQARHNGKAAMAFLDGHVELLTLDELGYAVYDLDTNHVHHDEGSNALWNGLGYDHDATHDDDDHSHP